MKRHFTVDRKEDEKREEVLRWGHPFFGSVWNGEDHSMLDKALEAYVSSKVGCFHDSLMDARARQASLHVVGILESDLADWLREHGYTAQGASLDPRTKAREKKGQGKTLSNSRRPFCLEAQKDDGTHGLIFVVVPGRDYVVHFAQLLIQYTTKYLKLTTAASSVLTDWLKERLEVHIYPLKCRDLFSTLGLKHSLCRRPDAKKHTVILGYSEFFYSFCEPKLRPEWAMEEVSMWDEQEFRVQELWNQKEGSQLSFLSVRHTYWGDISYYLAQTLYGDCRVDEILYCAKLGSVNSPTSILTTLFFPSAFIVAEEKFELPNCLSRSAPSFAVKSSHWSVPTILDETQAKISEVGRQHGPFDSVDNEIGQMARAARDKGKSFGAAHFATDFIHRYEKQAATGESLNSTDLTRLQVMKTLQADSLVSYFTKRDVAVSVFNQLRSPALLPRGAVKTPPEETLERACQLLGISSFHEIVDWVHKHDPLSYFALRDQGCAFFLRYLYDMRSLTCAERLSNFDPTATSGRLHFWSALMEVQEVKPDDTVLVSHRQAGDVRKQLGQLKNPSQVLELPQNDRFEEQWSLLSNKTIADVLGLDPAGSEDGIVAREFVLKLLEPFSPNLNSRTRRVAFKTMTVKGFGVFEEKYEYEIGDSGVHLVTGELKNLQSNGFGKTTLSVSALLWCLSGLMEASISEYRKRPEHLLHRKANGTTVEEAWVMVQGTVQREDGLESRFSLERAYKKGSSAKATLVMGAKEPVESVSVSMIADELFSFSCDKEVERRRDELEADQGSNELLMEERTDGLKSAAFRDFLLGAVFWGRDSRCGFLKEDRRFKGALGILRPQDDRRQRILDFAQENIDDIDAQLNAQQVSANDIQQGKEQLESQQGALKSKRTTSEEIDSQSLVGCEEGLGTARSALQALIKKAKSKDQENLKTYVKDLDDLKKRATIRDLKTTGKWRDSAVVALVKEYAEDPIEANIAAQHAERSKSHRTATSQLEHFQNLILGKVGKSDVGLYAIQEAWRPLHDSLESLRRELQAEKGRQRTYSQVGEICSKCQQGVSAKHKKDVLAQYQEEIDRLQTKIGAEEQSLKSKEQEFENEKAKLVKSGVEAAEECRQRLSSLEAAILIYRTRREDLFQARSVAKKRADDLKAALEVNAEKIAQLEKRSEKVEAELAVLRGRLEFWKKLLENCGDGKILDLRLQENVLRCFSSRVNYFLRLLTWRPEGRQEVSSAKFFSLRMQLGEGDTPKIKQEFFHGTKSVQEEVSEPEMTMEQQVDQGDLREMKPVSVNKQALSTSEYMRCHLAFFLAYGELFEERYGVTINLRVFDECFSGMDAYGIAMVLQTLEHLTKQNASPVQKEGESDKKKQKEEPPVERSFIVAAISPMLHILFKWGRVYMLTDKATVEKL